jgi:hypothetical protein
MRGHAEDEDPRFLLEVGNTNTEQSVEGKLQNTYISYMYKVVSTYLTLHTNITCLLLVSISL